MIRRIFLPTILLVLAYGFWVSPDFKEISAGVAIFLFGMLALEEIVEEIAAEESGEARPLRWSRHAGFLRLVGKR